MVGFPSNLPNFRKFFGRCFVFEGLSYWYITRGLFSRPRYHREEPYMMGSLFGQTLPSAAAKNPT